MKSVCSSFGTLSAIASAIVSLLSGSPALAAFNWSSKGACQNLFLTLNESQHAEAKHVMLTSSSSHNALAVLQPHVWEKPIVLTFAGPQGSGKTTALNQAVFPAARANGYSAVRVEVSSLIESYKKNETMPTFEDFQVLAIEDLDLTVLSYSRYVAVAELVRERFLRGQSTILILKGEAPIVRSDRNEFSESQDQVMDFVTLSTGGRQDDILTVNFDLKDARSTKQ